MLNLNDMLLFTEVAERGGFAAAARAMEIPKSRVSRRVAALEAQLGVRLLNRTTRRLSLTEAGKLYLGHCAAMRDEAEAAATAVAGLQAEPRGTIKLTCPVTLAQTQLGALVPGFLSRYPKVRLEMEVTNRVVNPVEEGVDVALRVRASLDDSGSLIVKRLGMSSTLLVASPDLLRRTGRPDEPAGLSRLPTVAMSSLDGHAVWHLSGPDGQSFEFPHAPRYVADDLLSLKFAVTAGLGTTPLPTELCREELASGALEQVLPGWTPPKGVVHAVFASRRGLATSVRAFLDYLGEHWPRD